MDAKAATLQKSSWRLRAHRTPSTTSFSPALASHTQAAHAQPAVIDRHSPSEVRAGSSTKYVYIHCSQTPRQPSDGNDGAFAWLPAATRTRVIGIHWLIADTWNKVGGRLVLFVWLNSRRGSDQRYCAPKLGDCIAVVMSPALTT
jgi:hypothetical protein